MHEWSSTGTKAPRGGGGDGAAQDVIRDEAERRGGRGGAGERATVSFTPSGRGQMPQKGRNVKARKAQLVRHVLHPSGREDETMQVVA